MKIDLLLAEFVPSGKNKATSPGGYYAGNPYYVTGNALIHALSNELSLKEKQNLSISHGHFLNMYRKKQFRHTNRKGHSIGANIPPIETYHDFFKFRRPPIPYKAPNFLKKEPFPYSALDEHDTPDIYTYTTNNNRKIPIQKRRFINFYCIGLQRDPDIFTGIHLGGMRSYGFGEIRIVDHKTINLNTLDYTCLKDAEWVELITPLCTASQINHTMHYDGLPQFMGAQNPSGEQKWRTRKEWILEAKKRKWLTLIDHRQVFKYLEGNMSKKETAKQGIKRILNHKKYGYGEFLIR